MNRRDALRLGAAWTLSVSGARSSTTAGDGPHVMTVRGPITPEAMGTTLPHEHVMVDFIGAEKVSRDRYKSDEVFSVALPHLKRARRQGVRTLVECTPSYLGRDPALLGRLAEAADLHILTNTGYYAASGGKYLPEHARTESADELTARWLRDWREGIDGTGIRPGFLKIGTDAGPLPAVNRKLVRAAARTNLASGLTIAAHTGDGAAAMEEIAIVRDEGVDPSAFVWVHAQNEGDLGLHAKAAGLGAWVEFDGVGPRTIDRHVELVSAMKARGLLGNVLVSHDAGWYHVGEPGGGEFRTLDVLATEFLPALKKAGLTDAEIRRLTVENPRDAFTIRVRRSR